MTPQVSALTAHVHLHGVQLLIEEKARKSAFIIALLQSATFEVKAVLMHRFNSPSRQVTQPISPSLSLRVDDGEFQGT